jgi:hypothetical protein
MPKEALVSAIKRGEEVGIGKATRVYSPESFIV